MPEFPWVENATPYIVLAILLLILSGIFSLIKIVFLALSVTTESEEDEKLVKKVNDFVDAPGFNETISIARTVLNVTAAVLGFVATYVLTERFYGNLELGIALYVLLAGFVEYLVVVLVPNMFGAVKPETFSHILLPIYKYIRLPFVLEAKLANILYLKVHKALGYDSKLSFLSEDKRDALQSDLNSDMSDEDEDALDEDERQMVLNIFDFVETPVREIMTPRVDMVAIDITASLAETIQVLNEERHSRVPVYRESVDNIIGVLSARDFLEWYTEHGKEPFDLQSLLNPVVFVPQQKKIDDLLRELRENGNQLAIVVDEYGGVAGLVTVEDIVEEIVGEIKDEDDLEDDAMIQKLKDGRYIFNPLITLSDFEDATGIELKEPEGIRVETVSGLILAKLGTIPSAGAEVEMSGHKFRVLKMEGTRMTKAMFIPPDKLTRKIQTISK
ncbi:MAG: HlyC/CorC family transporter [Fibrobacter sp.]|nr:HlyC/CorC family transporter [Fibrobacter sp.]